MAILPSDMGWIMGLNREVWIQKPDRLLIQHGSMPWILAALILIILTGCAPLDLLALPPTNSPVPTGTKVVFPPTWTEPPPTATATASITPSPTITPTITATSSPTALIEPTSVSLEPSPTTDWSIARLPDCTFTATQPGIRILSAPFIDPYHVLPTMEPGKPYPAVLTKPTYTMLLEKGQPLGWVDYRLLTLTHEGGDCLTNYDDREVWDFPLCFFSPLQEINGYADSDFTEPLHTLYPQYSYVVLYQSERTIFSAYGSSGPSFVVKRDEVYTHGKCDDIPALAKATTETHLYSDLPDRGGTIVYTLGVDEPIFLQSQQKNAGPPPGVSGTGYWILARRHSWAEDINGWVWSGHIEAK
jgi:hypothetical protein